LRNVAAVEFFLVACAATLATVVGTATNNAERDVMVALLAVALGIQNAAVRRLAVPDITTSVLTMTLTGIAAELRTGNPRVALRRGLSVAAMLAGGFVGAVLVLDVNIPAAIWAASSVFALVLVGAFVATRHDATWQARV
jgi:uncharacterized membrane protein YoaK (UPF0700 family)